MALAFPVRLRRRTDTLFCVFVVAFVALALRLTYIQVYHHRYWAEWAARFHTRNLKLHARRGPILDRTGRELAISVPCTTVSANPRLIEPRERPAVAKALSAALGIPAADLLDIISQDRGYVYIRRQLPLEVGAKVEALHLPGVMVEREHRRFYPGGSFCSHVLGFTDIDGNGLGGVELALNKHLAGADGEYTAELDARRHVIPDTVRNVRPARDGRPVTLSIDSALQKRAEYDLDAAVSKYQAKGGVCIVMDVHTGEVLAMAVSPRFDPNKPTECASGAKANRAVQLAYEPGSTMKAITCAVALDSGAVKPTDTFYCGGKLKIGRRTVHCALHAPFSGGHGVVRIAEILKHSCNVGAASVAMKVGQRILQPRVSQFGLGARTGIELPGESRGRLPSEPVWTPLTVATVGFGQTLMVTPMQIITAYAALANDGVLMPPTVLKRDPRHLPRGRRVVSAQTAALIRTYLQAVVDGGTGKAAKIAGYKCAGKTGTAQKARPSKRIVEPPTQPGGKPTIRWKAMGYDPTKFVGSFVGFVPAAHPRVAILAAIDEPVGAHYGAVVAAPVFREVAREAMARLGVPPDDPSDKADGAVPGSFPRAEVAE